MTADRAGSVEALAARLSGASASDVAETPFVLIGTVEEMAAQLLRQAEDLGITRYVVREPAVESMTAVLALLST